MEILIFKHAVTEKEKNELDQLLWNVLWKPLGLPHDIRQSFKLNYPQIELIAVDNGNVVGGLVANWLSDDEIEIRHIAVYFDYQGRSVGRRLVGKLIELVELDVPITIHTYARNTSAGFFSKLGFIQQENILSIQILQNMELQFKKCIVRFVK